MVHIIFKSGETLTARSVQAWVPGGEYGGWFTISTDDGDQVVYFETIAEGHEDGECLLERHRRSVMATVWPT